MTTSSTVRTMALRSSASSGASDGTGLPEEGRPETPKEAAEQFEEVLVRQFVDVMTKGMFSNSLTGEDGGGWMKSQRDRQRHMMTDMITDQLVDAGNLEISDKLTKQWGVSGASDGSSSSDDSSLQQPVDPLPVGSPGPPTSSTDAPPTHEGHTVDHVV